jgi:hypothetical protein
MEVQDGFILGVYNYCDRWCEACPFTSRCRVFADGAEHEAERDPNFNAVTTAPPHPSDIRETPAWLAEAIEEMNVLSMSALSLPEERPLPEYHAAIVERARGYGVRVHHLDELKTHDTMEPTHPLSVISWFSTLISAKVFRALTGLLDDDGDREFPPDHEGSAKVALIGIDRSISSWEELVAAGRVSEQRASSFVADLGWLRQALETLLPNARVFVRPGFDEPCEVTRLEATDLS